MATPTGTLWARDAHTVVKHQMLDVYLQAWFPIIAKKYTDTGLTYVDVFAGPGEYLDHSFGSPVITLTQANRPDVTQHGAATRLFADDHLRDLLDIRFPAASRPATWDLRILNCDCRAVLVNSLTQMQAWNGPMFVNFDGWGVDTPYALVQRVGQVKSSEVLITVQTQFFIRFAKMEDIDAGDVVFGDPAWREVAKSGSPNEKKRELVNLYRERLHQANFTFTLTFELVDEGGHDLFLIFGTQHELGVEKMKDSMWKVDKVQGQSFRDPRDLDQLTFAISEHPDLTLNRPGIRGGSIPWKRGWCHGITGQGDTAAVLAGGEGAGGAVGPSAPFGVGHGARDGASCR